MALAGTPAEVLEQVRRSRDLPKIRRIIILPQVPGEGFGERETILRLFAEEVIARVS
jgi:alkanesulfonate monooxygenase SsuD/methylene tetrahydromethanopterin reductase-like flavin-dependent oxidoreductase (luciferase family)